MSGNKTEEWPTTVLLRHQGSKFDRDVIGRWLADETNMLAELVIKPNRSRKIDTLRHEYRRSGLTGLLDALAFRSYYNFRLAEKENQKIESLIHEARNQYPDYQVNKYTIEDPNSRRTVSLLQQLKPDLMVARCRVLLDKHVFAQPTHGTFVVHPGICPEYRNQHGCFWALANGDDQKVGYSLLRIDDGIDTGEIYVQNGTTFDPQNDEHRYIQLKVVADNLDEIGDALNSVHRGTATSVDTTGRPSAAWGMPRLSAWLTWKRRVRHFDITYVDSTTE